MKSLTNSLVTALMLVLAAHSTHATIVASSDPSAFTLTEQTFTPFGGTTAAVLSDSGNLSLDDATGLGSDPTNGHQYTFHATVEMTGTSYAVGGDENFDITFVSGSQNVLAFDLEEFTGVSNFQLSFFQSGSFVESTNFVSDVFDTERFFAFTTDFLFDSVSVREIGTGTGNEYFQFYLAEGEGLAVPASGTLVMGLFALGALVRRKVFARA